MKAAGWKVPSSRSSSRSSSRRAPPRRGDGAEPEDLRRGHRLRADDLLGPGHTTAPVTAVDVRVPTAPTDPNSTTPRAARPPTSPASRPGNVALVQRGTCPFGQKAAERADRRRQRRRGLQRGSARTRPMSSGHPGRAVGIPAIGIDYKLGADTVTRLPGGTAVTWHVLTHRSARRAHQNVIADSPFGDPTARSRSARTSTRCSPARHQRRRLGHLDGLELAENLAEGREAAQPLRFLWVGAEELGLLGSSTTSTR